MEHKMLQSHNSHNLGDHRPTFRNWTTLAYLEEVYPGQAVLTVVQTARVLGIAEKTLRNRLIDRRFPIENIGEPRKPCFLKIDVAVCIDAMKGLYIIEKVKQKRGKPCKKEVMEARAAGLSVPEYRRQKGVSDGPI
jgi:hypothetical protein